MAKKKSTTKGKVKTKKATTKQEGEKVSFVEIKDEMSFAEKIEGYQHNIETLTKIKNSLVLGTPIDEKDSKIMVLASRLSLINEKIILMAMTKAQLEIASQKENQVQ